MKNKAVKILLGIAIAIVICGVGYYKFHPHNYVLVDEIEPNCTQDGYKNFRCWCGSDNKETIKAIGHDYQEEIIDATCTEDGKKIFTCANCGDTYEESIKAIGHDYKEEVTTEPTCTEDGVTTFTCNNCDDTYTEPIAPLGHSYIDGICERCGELSEEKKKESGGGSGNGGSGSSSQKPSVNSGQSGNNVSNETPSNDTSAGAAAWGVTDLGNPGLDDVCDSATHISGE